MWNAHDKGRPQQGHEWLYDPPELWPGLEFFFEAWRTLSMSRQQGFGPGPIPFESVLAYADYRQIAGDELDELLHHIQAMDRAYLIHVNAKADKDKPDNPKRDEGK